MLKFLQKKIYPIGIDLGLSSLKMIQLGAVDRGVSLIAAARAEVPRGIQQDPPELQQWYISNIGRLLSERPFQGKKIVTALPSREIKSLNSLLRPSSINFASDITVLQYN